MINLKACASALIKYFGGSKPVLLADAEYRRQTKSDLLRHPLYKGLRVVERGFDGVRDHVGIVFTATSMK